MEDQPSRLGDHGRYSLWWLKNMIRIAFGIALTLVTGSQAFALQLGQENFDKWVHLANSPTKFIEQHQSRLEDLSLDNEAGLRAFVESVDSRDLKVRRASILGVSLLAETDPAVSYPALLAAASDTDEQVRQSAIGAIGNLALAPKKSVPLLISVLKTHKADAAVASSALARFGADAKPAVHALVSLTSSNDPRTRGAACVALGAIGDKDQVVIDSLKQCWSDADISVRRKSTYAAWKLTASNVSMDELIKLLAVRSNHSTNDVFHTIEILGEIGTPAQDSLNQLGSFLGGNNAYEAMAALWAIHRIRDARQPLPEFIAGLHSTNEMERAGAAWALGKIGPPAKSAVPDLNRIMTDENEMGFMPLLAARALAKINAEE